MPSVCTFSGAGGPSTWSLGSAAREPHVGRTPAPPVPPWSLLHGKKTASGPPK